MKNIPLIAVPKYSKLGQGFSRAEKLQAMEHPGRRTTARGYQSPASYVCDLADSGSAILLCKWCATKFNFRRSRYRKRFVPDHSGKTDGFTVNGQCKACKQQTASMGGGLMFVTEATYNLVSIDPSEAKRRWRQMWRAHAGRMKRAEIMQDYANNPDKYGKKKSAVRVLDKRRFVR
jgi:hypothetical protein